MVLTAYFDESGTHGVDLTVMAGFLGDARQWRKFEKRASKLFSRFGVNVFHCIDVKRSDRDFRGWSVDRKIAFLDEFHHIINETVEFGFASVLREEDYSYYLSLPWPNKARRDSRYALLYRACMAATIDGVLSVRRWQGGREPRLNVVLESGHRNAPDVVRLYDFFKKRLGDKANKSLASLTFESKEECLPLGAADLFAYSVYGQEAGGKPIGQPKKPLKSDSSYPGNLYRIPLVRDTLLSLYEQGLKFASGDLPSPPSSGRVS
jgi:Protein of unknown function (DUF3800)